MGKKPVADMKYAFDGLTTSLDTARKIIIELEGSLIEISQTEIQREKKKRTFKNYGTFQKV